MNALLLLLPAALAAGVDRDALSETCGAGDPASCLSLARALTGAGLPVDILGAQEAYKRACDRGSSEGCKGAEGVGRLLGRHVDLHLLGSVPRVWALSGPSWVTTDSAPEPALPEVAEAVAKRLTFAELCYRTAVEEDPQLEGLIDLSLVREGGRTTQLLLHNASFDDVDTATCILDAIGRARLPEQHPDGELFLRLRAEPAPRSDRAPPAVQDHLADGAQSTIGDPELELPVTSLDRRRLEIAATAAARRQLAGNSCVLDEVKSARWGLVELSLRLTVEADGEASSVAVVASPPERTELAECVQSALSGLRIGETGLTTAVRGTVSMKVAPAWTATWVPGEQPAPR